MQKIDRPKRRNRYIKEGVKQRPNPLDNDGDYFIQSSHYYDVNIDACSKSLSSGVPDFKKSTKRPSFIEDKGFSMPECYDADKIESASKKLSDYKRSKNPISFDKSLPRDNKMFRITETYNLDEKEDTFLDKFKHLGILGMKGNKKITTLLT